VVRWILSAMVSDRETGRYDGQNAAEQGRGWVPFFGCLIIVVAVSFLIGSIKNAIVH
jgi:hypothetical protein